MFEKTNNSSGNELIRCLNFSGNEKGSFAICRTAKQFCTDLHGNFHTNQNRFANSTSGRLYLAKSGCN